MKKKIILSTYLVIALFIITGCIDDNYGEDSNDIVTNLTENNWERTYNKRLQNGSDVKILEHYEFQKNSKGFCKTYTAYTNGKKEEKIFYFQYTFITPNYKYILIDGSYWQIDKLTSSILSIYETWENPLTTLGQPYRENKIFSGTPL